MINSFRPPPPSESIAAVLLAALVAVLFLGSSILPGNTVAPFPPESLQPLRAEALADGSITAPELLRGNPQFGDKFSLVLPWDRLLHRRLRDGELPLWTREFGGGTPVAPLMCQVYQPWNLLLLLLPAESAYGPWVFGHLLLFACFAYRFLRRLQFSHSAALLGMLTVEAGFWSQARVHHGVMLTAALPTFAVLSCVHQLVVHRGGLGHAGLLALGIALSWLAGFAPISLQLTYLAIAYTLFLALHRHAAGVTDPAWPGGGRWRAVAVVAASMALGALLAAAQIVPVLLAAAVSSRAPATMAELVASGMEWDHLLTLCYPTLFEWPAAAFHGTPDRVRPSWAALALLDRQLLGAGFNFPETACYLGLVPSICALLGVARLRRHPQATFFAAVAAVGLATALATPGVMHAVALLPGTDSGDIKRFLYLFAVGTPVLVALGYDGLTHQVVGPRHPKRRVAAVIALSIAAVLAACSLVLGLLHLAPAERLRDLYGGLAEAHLHLPAGTMQKWVAGYPEEGALNRGRLLQCLFHAATVAGLATALFVGVAQGCDRGRRRRLFLGSLLALTAIDLLVAGWGTRVAVPVARVQRAPAILAPLVTATAAAAARHAPRPRLHRLLPPGERRWQQLPLNPNLGASLGLEDLGLYCSLPPQRSVELTLAVEPTIADEVPAALPGIGIFGFRRTTSLGHPLLDLLGVEWVLVAGEPDAGTLRRFGLVDATPPGLPPGFALLRRTTALPRTTFITDVEIIPDPAARLRRLADPAREVRGTMILEAAEAPALPERVAGAAAAQVEVLHHGDERVEVAVINPVAGYLRLADPYDAGWTATVDGRPTEVWIADHALRAVHLPPGEHLVRFAFDAPRVLWPRRLSLVGLMLCLALLGAGLVRRARTPPRAPADEEERADQEPQD